MVKWMGANNIYTNDAICVQCVEKIHEIRLTSSMAYTLSARYGPTSCIVCRKDLSQTHNGKPQGVRFGNCITES